MARTAPVLLALSTLLLAPPPRAWAQNGPGMGEEHEVGAGVSVRAGVTWLGKHALPIGALSGTIRLTERMELGGEAVIGLDAVRLSPLGSPDRSELTTGYGGILVRWRPAGDQPGVRWGGSLQIGAGTARIRSPLAESAIVAENYFLLEPRVGVLFRQDRQLRFSAQGGYRITTGLDELPGIHVGELRGVSLLIGAQFVFDPEGQL